MPIAHRFTHLVAIRISSSCHCSSGSHATALRALAYHSSSYLSIASVCDCWNAVAVFSLTQFQPQGVSISRLGVPTSLTIQATCSCTDLWSNL
ncbi:hypothetical protein EJ06DRAFT_510110 [Trichodelitschia bisporula]|uniref:Uncharacterized protein n=1 Tax=Trichodelitschia bisporula TaxID=703511 RepID=A0A6G1HVQ5_9PEZI|nr:hypothetical protein EJ06DRAFT_510110 [Trichodelitschia bisporula]